MKSRFQCSKTGFNFRCAHILATLLAMTTLFGRPNTAHAQKEQKYYIGDIVEYDDFFGGTSYGLILEMNPSIKIERLDSKGNFKDGSVKRSGKVTLIDSLRKKTIEQARRWQSADGEFTLEATLVSFDDNTVRLKNADGKILPIPKSKLCEKDHAYLDRSKLVESKNPFEVAPDKDFPEEVLTLIARRGQLMELQLRHQQLIRLRREPLVGDIVRYQTRSGTLNYGIIASLDSSGKVETIDEDGELDQVSTSLKSLKWWYFDREVRPIVARSWKSANGKFSIEAKMVGIEGSTVVLEKLDGKQTKVPLAKLDITSKKYAEKLRSRFEDTNDSIVNSRESYDAKLQMLLVRRDELLERLRTDIIAAKEAANIKAIPIMLKPIEISADQLKPESIDGKSFSASVGIQAAPSSRIESISYSKDSGLVAFTTDPRTGSPKLFVVGVDSNSVVGSDSETRVGEDAKVLSISPSGEIILVFSRDERKKQQLELWKHQQGQLSRTATVPYESNRTPNASLFSDSNGIILDAMGNAVFFEISDRITPTHIVSGSGRSGRGGGLQVSDDGKSIFYSSTLGNELYVLDIETKKCVGGIRYDDPEKILTGSAKVNADGKTVSYVCWKRSNEETISTIDLKTGDLIDKNPIPSSQTFHLKTGKVPSLAPNLLLSDDQKIFDTKLEVVIGTIKQEGFTNRIFSNTSRITASIKENKGLSAARGGFGGTTIGVVEEEIPSRVEIQSETLDVQQIIAFANSLTASDVVTFGSGSSINLDIDLGDSSAEKMLRSKLTSEMSAAGITIDSGSDFVMKVRFEAGKPETKTFNIVEVQNAFGGMAKRFDSSTGTKRTVTVTPKKSSAQLMFKGSVLWANYNSASLGRPYSEADLNKRIKETNQLTPRKTLEYKYPTELKILNPNKKKDFEWK